MATLTANYKFNNDQGQSFTASITLTYSVSSTNTVTSLSLTKTTASVPGALHENPEVTIIADGEVLYTGYDFVNTFSNVGKSWNRGTSAASKTLRLTIQGGAGAFSSTASISVPALPSYDVTYNANGGSGAPATQKKYYGKSLALSSSKPSRSNAAFSKWNTKANGSGTNYNPGATYTANAALTLYAIWLPKPQVASLTAVRCDEYGNDDDEGTCCLVECTWSLDTSINASVQSATVSGTIAPQGGAATPFSLSGDVAGAGGTATAIITGLDTDEQYTVKVTATAGTQSTSRSAIMTRAFFIMDFKAGGEALGIGRAAPQSGLEIGFATTFDEPVTLRENATFPETNRGIYGTDSTGYVYPLVKDNGTNMWIGASQSATKHHTGSTFLSAGHNGTSGNDSIYVSIPNDDNTSGTNYKVWHDGYKGAASSANLPLGSGVTAYESSSTPKCHKWGNVVCVCGEVKPTAAVAANGTLNIGTLASGYRPKSKVVQLCQGSGGAVWLLEVFADGNMRASRYRNGSTYAEMTTSTWLPFNVTFVV